MRTCPHLIAVLLVAGCAATPAQRDAAPEAAVIPVVAAPDGVAVFDGDDALTTSLVDPAGDDGRLTIECMVRGPAPQGTAALFGNRHYGGLGLTWAHEKLAPDRPTAWIGVTHVPGMRERGYLLARAPRPWDYDAWTHVALTFDGSLLRLWVDGRLAAEAFALGKRRKSGRPIVIGADAAKSGVGQFFHGEIDDVRVSSVVRYAADFTPPGSHVPDAATLLLLDFDDAADPFADRSGRAAYVVPFGDPIRRAR